MAKNGVDELPHCQRTERGHVTPDVVTERSARATQARGEQLREIDRITAEQSELAEAHQGNHPEDVVEAIEKPEGTRGAGHGQRERQRERRSSSEAVRDHLETVN